MLEKYNLALTPNTNGNEAVKIAQQIAFLADEYLLGDNSLPHVTLYHFEAEKTEIDKIWRATCEAWKTKSILLEFTEFSYTTSDEVTYWIALLPNNRDRLHDMHCLIADIIQQPIKDSFDPHMTLLNTKNKNCKIEIEKIARSYTAITDTFTLSLGKSDPVGQLTEIVHRYHQI